MNSSTSPRTLRSSSPTTTKWRSKSTTSTEISPSTKKSKKNWRREVISVRRWLRGWSLRTKNFLRNLKANIKNSLVAICHQMLVSQLMETNVITLWVQARQWDMVMPRSFLCKMSSSPPKNWSITLKISSNNTRRILYKRSPSMKLFNRSTTSCKISLLSLVTSTSVPLSSWLTSWRTCWTSSQISCKAKRRCTWIWKRSRSDHLKNFQMRIRSHLL